MENELNVEVDSYLISLMLSFVHIRSESEPEYFEL